MQRRGGLDSSLVRPLIVACIPAKNEERTVARVIVETMRYVDKVIIVDDGSTDLTGEIAGKLGVEVIRHDENMGYGAALASLFKRAIELSPDIVVTLDADSQHDPREIPLLVEPITAGKADIVVGSRFLNGGSMANGSSNGYRKAGIEAITKLSDAASYKGLTDSQSGMRAYSVKAAEVVIPSEQGMGASTEILMKASEAGLKVAEVPINVSYDVEKPSKINPVLHGFDVVLSTVKHLSMRKPLLFYGAPGMVAFCTSLFFWAWTLEIFSDTGEVSTNIALIALGATLVGLMLLATAVLLWVLISVVREEGNKTQSAKANRHA